MPVIEQVQRYSAFLYPNPLERRGRINLYCTSSSLYVIFVDPKSAMPPNSYNSNAKIGTAYQTLDDYARYLDLVRNEGPISVTFSTETNPPSFVVYCASETPGEGEV